MVRISAFAMSIGLSVGLLYLLTMSPHVRAERLGGPANETLTLPAGQTVLREIPFVGGKQAIINVTGANLGQLEMAATDVEGVVWEATGDAAKKTINIRVQRDSKLRLSLKSTSQSDVQITLTTN